MGVTFNIIVQKMEYWHIYIPMTFVQETLFNGGCLKAIASTMAAHLRDSGVTSNLIE